MTNETWGIVRDELLKTVGRNNFATWIEPLQFSGLSEGVAKFLVPTNFFGTWVSRNFADQIRQQLISAGHDVERVEFSVRNAPRPAVDKPAESSEAPARTGFDFAVNLRFGRIAMNYASVAASPRAVSPPPYEASYGEDGLFW